MEGKHSITALIDEGALYIGDGYRAKLEELSSTGIPFARAGNIDGGFHFEGADHFPEENLARVGNKISEPGDVVFTSKGTVGRFALVRESTPRFVYSPQLCFWRVLNRAKIEPRFLYYWMSSREFYSQFKGVAGQTDMAEYVSLGDQRRMYITLPNIDRQKKIAATLGPLDDKIELNRRTNETLEAIARAVFKSWFVDFDPVRADPLTASELGPIPAGWRIAILDEHVEATKGLSYKGQALSAGAGMPLHNLNSICEGGGYKFEGIKHYTGEFKDRHTIRTGDIIVANTEQGFDYLLIGFPAIVPKRFGELGLFSHHLFRVKPRDGSPLTRYFLYYLLMMPLVRDQIIGCTNGTTVNMLAPDGLKMPRFPLPPAAMVQRFEVIAASIHHLIEANLETNETLAAIRDTLLPKLISGEIRINKATKLIEAYA